MSEDHQFEPVPGLPRNLPDGERMLWQGRPAWRTLAWRGFGLRWLGVYFVVLAAWAAGLAWQAGAPAAIILTQASWLLGLGVAVGLLVALYAWLCARNTIYTITDKRVVIRSGLAVDMAVNLPFRLIESASMRADADGRGDVVLTVAAPHRVALLSLWPHVRPWRYRKPEPMLRALTDAPAVARLLARALAGTGGMARAPLPPKSRHAPQPAGLAA